MSIHIRPFKAGDEIGISIAHERAIREICGQDYTAEQINAWTANISPQRYLNSIANNGERFWVIDHAGTIGGFAGWYASQIQGFYLHPNYRGAGLAKQLFEIVEQEFWAESGERVCHIDSTITAKAFYQKMGFAPLKPAVHTLPDGTPLNIWLMQKSKS